MSIKVTIVRHGQTEGNTRSAANSKMDEELNESGMEQGTLFGKYLKSMKINFRKVYTSDMTRAVQTAVAIVSELGDKDLEIIQTAELRERSYGDWDDKTIKDLFRIAKESGIHPVQVVANGGETNEQAIQRFITFLKSLLDFQERIEDAKATKEPRNYLLVMHSGIIFGFLHKLLMCPGEEFIVRNLQGQSVFYPIANTSFSTFVMYRERDNKGEFKICFEFEDVLCSNHLPEKYQETKKLIVYTNDKQCKVNY